MSSSEDLSSSDSDDSTLPSSDLDTSASSDEDDISLAVVAAIRETFDSMSAILNSNASANNSSFSSTSDELFNTSDEDSHNSTQDSEAADQIANRSNYDSDMDEQQGSSDTEAYDVDAAMAQVDNGTNEVIEINDTQRSNNFNNISHNDSTISIDDDVIFIQPNVVTIDLCTQVQSAPIPPTLRDEIIDITNSPATQEPSRAGPIRTRRRSRLSNAELQPSAQPSTSKAQQKLNLDDSLNSSQTKRVSLPCAICLDSLIDRSPVTTTCGHMFCKACLLQALKNAKKCPMCKKTLNGKKPFLDVFLPC